VYSLTVSLLQASQTLADLICIGGSELDSKDSISILRTRGQSSSPI
jgi:hypothetical protein